MSKGGSGGVAEDFYPFVDNGETHGEPALVPHHPARIAVYDDASAAPRVVEVEPKDVRAYLEEITLQVTQLAQAQGGSIPFMVIREIVENLIHAYFIQPTVSILDHGNTIRFSDQGPGIRQKDRALQYGTTSATEEMRHYIRGVGSGLPYVQQYMHDKGGSLRIEDNMSGGTVVTLSAVGNGPAMSQTPAIGPQAPQAQQSPWQGYQQEYQQGYQQPFAQPQQPWQAQQQYGQTPGQPWQNSQGWQQPQQGWQSPGQTWQSQQPWQQNPWQQQYGTQPYGGQPYGAQPYGGQAPAMPTPPQEDHPASSTGDGSFPWPTLSQRGEAVLEYLRTHDAVGPSDLARAQGGSQPTWTRELQALEDQGFVRKDGQKRRLTALGQSYLHRNG